MLIMVGRSHLVWHVEFTFCEVFLQQVHDTYAQESMYTSAKKSSEAEQVIPHRISGSLLM